MKLLSPAGNLESLRAAVYNGADEVYLGVNEFNARNNIDSFTIATLSEAVDFCHIFGVKVSLAINILFTGEELLQALNTVISAYNIGVDYFIVQDLALAKLIRERLPKAKIHASTQMAIHNLEGVKAILPYGFSRVVLARETPLAEIKRIKENVDIEIEYFVHGALCVSFSGNCYLSSYLQDASGNRGKCKQLCRLPYTLNKDGKTLKSGYLLSAKDFDMSNRLADLKQAGVDVLKIEGRARRPFYVATATSHYRNLLDGQTSSKTNLELAFNRGFTDGYFSGNGRIISNQNNHTGTYIGKITKVIEKKTYNEVYFTSSRELSKKSSFKTYFNGQERAVVTAFDLNKVSKNEYYLTTTAKITKGEDIHLIVDYSLEKQAEEKTKKVYIPISVYLKEHEKIRAEFKINGKTQKVEGDALEPSKSAPLTIEEISKNLKKSEMFDLLPTFYIDGKVFLAKSRLNDFRREILSSIKTQLVAPYKRNEQPATKTEIEKIFSQISANFSFPFEDFTTVEEVDEISRKDAKNIIYSPEFYEIKDIERAKNTATNLKKKLYLDLPNFALSEDVENLKNIVEKLQIPFIANNYYSLDFKGEKIIGAGLNVYNEYTAKLFNAPYITAEMTGKSKIDFAYMTLRHCPYKSHLGGDCKNCPHQKGYYLKMQSGEKLQIKRKKLSTCTFYLTK